MGAVTVRRQIETSAEQAWEALADLGNIHLFNPHLAGSHLPQADAECGVGTQRVCDLKRGGSLHERVIDWRPGESYTVEVEMPGMPIVSMRTRMAVRPLDGTRGEVSMDTEYRPRFSAAGWVMDVLMLRHVMRHMLGGVLAGLDRHLTEAARAAAATG